MSIKEMCIRDSVAHRSQVYVKAQIQQKGGLVQGVGPDGLQPCLLYTSRCV